MPTAKIIHAENRFRQVRDSRERMKLRLELVRSLEALDRDEGNWNG